MNRIFYLAAIVLLTACGYSHRDNDLVGQPKSVESTTPLICPDQHVLHLSLGVMRHGVGSMSTEDIQINIPDARLVPVLQSVVESGKLINARTNEARFRWCNEEKELVSFEIMEDEPAGSPKAAAGASHPQ
jgi:outer membrane lipopolysaccharide assembly protein LptE/RlpB